MQTSDAAKPRRILVGYDFSSLADRALDTALEMARTEPTEVHVLVVDEEKVHPMDAFAWAVVPHEGVFAELKTHLAKRALVLKEATPGAARVRSIIAHADIGEPARAIVRLAATLEADLILVATHGRRGLSRAFLGSVAEHVVRRAPCPVLVVRNKGSRADAEADVEPPCPECASVRAKTRGATLWCERHAAHHPRAHVYSYDAPSSEAARPWGFRGT